MRRLRARPRRSPEAVKAQTDAIWERIPLALRDEYRGAWSAYARRPSPQTYAVAREMEDKLQDAIKAAASEAGREKAKALSG